MFNFFTKVYKKDVEKFKCKNDSTTYYTGNEPSPKGFGYCAHSEKKDEIKKGKDGNLWIISIVKNGIKRWTKITSKTYYPTNTYGNEYICYIGKNDIYIYIIDKNKSEKFINKYKIKKIFYGTDKYDNKKKVNTLLLQLSDLEYIFIGGIIYKFKTLEKIIKYYSNSIEGKNYPEPIAISKKNVYFLEPGDTTFYIPLKYFPKKISNEDLGNSYDLFYYNPSENKKLNNNYIQQNLKNKKNIHTK